MQYDIYYEKVNKFAGFMKKAFKFLWLIILVLTIIIAAVVSLLALKGRILDEDGVNATYVYGDEIDFSAKAFLSKVKTEFFVDGQWQKEPPEHIGSYKLRGVSRAAFGKNKYTSEYTFEIIKRDITVQVDSKTLLYGDDPMISAQNLVSGHSVVGGEYDLEFKKDSGADLSKTTLKLKADQIRVYDADQNDVTDCYKISVKDRSVNILQRHLTVTVSNKSIVYNNTVLAFDGYETDGNEADGDTVAAVFTASIIDVGEVQNIPEIRVLNKDGEDVTHFYELSLRTGKLKVDKRPIIIKTKSASKVYDAAPLMNTECELSGEYGVCDGHTLNLTFPMLINAGKVENLPKYKVTDKASGEDKTYNYSIFVESGELEITKRPVTIKTYGESKVYDAVPLILDDYDITGGLGICDVHTLDLLFTSFEDVTNEKNIPKYNITDTKSGVDVAVNYEITFDAEYVNISKRPIEIQVGSAEKTYDGEKLECREYDVIGEYDFCDGHVLSTVSFPTLTLAGTVKNEMNIVSIRNNDGRNVKNNYRIHYNQGTLTVNKRDITVTAPDGEWMYDSYDHSTEVLFSTDIGYSDVIYTTRTTVRFAGSVKNDVEVVLWHNTLGVVTKCYNITYKCGTLKVTKRPITIYTPSITQIYNGQPLVGNWVDAFGGEGIADNDYFDILSSSTITNVGSVKNEFYEYYFYTSNYDDDLPGLEEGDWEVIPVEEPTTSVDKLDGSDGFYGEENTEPADEPYYPDVSDKPGYDALMNSYEITWVHGTLTVTPREVHIRPADASKQYDGEPLYATDFVYCDSSPYEFVFGHKVTVSYSGSITELGTTSSRIVSGSIRVTDAKGNDVLQNYKIVATERGTLTVYPRPITIKTKDAEKEFDGSPLTCPIYSIVSGSFLDRHEVFFSITGSQTEIGRSPNTYDKDSVRVLILVPGGATVDVTKYYDITVVEGSLTVTDPNLELLEITPISLFKDYDGEYLYAINMLEENGLLGELLARGYHYSVEVSGSQREVGIGKSTIVTFHLFDENWKDVTHKYNLIRNEGILEVRAATVRVFLYELQKYYDGTPLEFRQDDYSIIYLPDECKLSLTLNISLTDVGEITLEQINENLDQYVSFRVFKDGVDITRNCKLIFDVFEGTHKDYVPIKISPRAIELTAVSAEKYYDGSYLQSNRAEVTKGTLVSGHELFVLTEGSIVDPGKEVNRIVDYYIIDTATGRIVTDNYAVKTIDGTLTVHEKSK